jgi:hypothetical protein
VRRIVALALVVALGFAAGALAACGDDTKVVTDTGSNGQATTQTVPDIRFAKTKFVLHAGLAFGAFHRYVYKPFREGKFRSGASGRRRAYVKAGLAGAFAYHELKVARKDALASDTLRRHLIPLIDALTSKFNLITTALKGGSLGSGAVLGAEAALSALKDRAAGDGAEIKDRSAPLPGA